MERLARFVLRHRLSVAGVWILLLLAGGASAGQLGDRLSFDFSLPGQPGYTAGQELLREYGVDTSDTVVPVVTVPEGQTVAQRRAEVDGVFAAVRKQVPGLRVVDLASTGDERFVTADGRSAYALIQGPPPTSVALGFQPRVVEALDAAAAAAGLTSGTTSYALLSQGDSEEEASTSVLIETLLGAGGALLVLAFVFASFLAFVPIVVAAFSILTTFLLVLLLSTVTM